MNKQIIVTGAAGGMGVATCNKLTSAGYHVIAIDNHYDNLQELVRLNANVEGMHLSIISPTIGKDIRAMINQSVQLVGLINIAGISKGDSLDKLTDDDWDHSFEVNVKGPMRLIRELSPLMTAYEEGSIVNVGSPVGIVGARKPSYAASKAALHGLTMSCARSLGSSNVRCNLLLPGPTITHMTDDWSDEKRLNIADGTVLKRLCTTDDIANMIEFLISDKSSYVTASVIDMTCGSTFGHKS